MYLCTTLAPRRRLFLPLPQLWALPSILRLVERGNPVLVQPEILTRRRLDRIVSIGARCGSGSSLCFLLALGRTAKERVINKVAHASDHYGEHEVKENELEIKNRIFRIDDGDGGIVGNARVAVASCVRKIDNNDKTQFLRSKLGVEDEGDFGGLFRTDVGVVLYCRDVSDDLGEIGGIHKGAGEKVDGKVFFLLVVEGDLELIALTIDDQGKRVV